MSNASIPQAIKELESNISAYQVGLTELQGRIVAAKKAINGLLTVMQEPVRYLDVLQMAMPAVQPAPRVRAPLPPLRKRIVPKPPTRGRGALPKVRTVVTQVSKSGKSEDRQAIETVARRLGEFTLPDLMNACPEIGVKKGRKFFENTITSNRHNISAVGQRAGRTLYRWKGYQPKSQENTGGSSIGSANTLAQVHRAALHSIKVAPAQEAPKEIQPPRLACVKCGETTPHDTCKPKQPAPPPATVARPVTPPTPAPRSTVARPSTPPTPSKKATPPPPSESAFSVEAIAIGKALNGSFSPTDLAARMEGSMTQTSSRANQWLALWKSKGWIVTAGFQLYTRTERFGT